MHPSKIDPELSTTLRALAHKFRRRATSTPKQTAQPRSVRHQRGAADSAQLSHKDRASNIKQICAARAAITRAMRNGDDEAAGKAWADFKTLADEVHKRRKQRQRARTPDAWRPSRGARRPAPHAVCRVSRRVAGTATQQSVAGDSGDDGGGDGPGRRPALCVEPLTSKTTFHLALVHTAGAAFLCGGAMFERTELGSLAQCIDQQHQLQIETIYADATRLRREMHGLGSDGRKAVRS